MTLVMIAFVSQCCPAIDKVAPKVRPTSQVVKNDFLIESTCYKTNFSVAQLALLYFLCNPLLLSVSLVQSILNHRSVWF